MLRGLLREAESRACATRETVPLTCNQGRKKMIFTSYVYFIVCDVLIGITAECHPSKQ